MVPAAFAGALAAMNHRLDAPAGTPLAVAFSGGSDSLGLLVIAKAWADAAKRPLCTLTVDHGLRPDSRHWAEAAGRAARRLGVPWRVLAWAGPKPATGLPAAARRARHAVLAEATRAAGARVILLGHTADDVAESELIRAETPTHGRLAEWAPSPAWPEGRGLFILRPLLSIGRTDLQGWLTAMGAAWLDDPANSDLRFARSRARLALAQVGEADGADEVLARPRPRPPLQPTVGRTWLPSISASRACGALDFDIATLLAAGRPAETLAKALACVSGRCRPSPGAATLRLLDLLAAGEPFKATLSGAWVRAAAGCVRLTRELGRAPPPPVLLTPGVVQVFDGRFEVQGQAPGWWVVPLAGHAAKLPRSDRDGLRGQLPDVRASLPALRSADDEIRLPHPFGGGPATAIPLVGPRFAAALGLVECESALEEASQPRQSRGAEPPPALS